MNLAHGLDPSPIDELTGHMAQARVSRRIALAVTHDSTQYRYYVALTSGAAEGPHGESPSKDLACSPINGRGYGACTVS